MTQYLPLLNLLIIIAIPLGWKVCRSIAKVFEKIEQRIDLNDERDDVQDRLLSDIYGANLDSEAIAKKTSQYPPKFKIWSFHPEPKKEH